MYIAEVRLLSALTQFDRPYSYLSDTNIAPGTVVAIPFGNSNRNQYGIVINSKEGTDESLKKILFTLPDLYSLTPIQLGCAEYIAEQFFSTFGDAARLMLPTGLDIDTVEYLVKGDNFDTLDSGEIKALIEKEGRIYIKNADEKKEFRKYLRSGQLKSVTEAVCHINEKKERYLKYLPLTPEETEERLKGS